MDNEQLLNEIGRMMDQRFEAFGAAMDQRIESALELFKAQISEVISGNCAELHTQIEQARRDLSADIQRLTARVDVVTKLMESLTPAFLSFMQDAGKTEAEFRLRLHSLETQLRRIDRPRGDAA